MLSRAFRASIQGAVSPEETGNRGVLGDGLSEPFPRPHQVQNTTYLGTCYYQWTSFPGYAIEESHKANLWSSTKRSMPPFVHPIEADHSLQPIHPRQPWIYVKTNLSSLQSRGEIHGRELCSGHKLNCKDWCRQLRKPQGGFWPQQTFGLFNVWPDDRSQIVFPWSRVSYRTRIMEWLEVNPFYSIADFCESHVTDV